MTITLLNTAKRLTFPGGLRVRLGQALMFGVAFTLNLRDVDRETDAAEYIGAGLGAIGPTVFAGWVLFFFRPMLLPGGSDTMKAQLAAWLGIVIWRVDFDQSDTDVFRGLTKALLWSALLAWPARAAISGVKFDRKLNYVGSGQALADRIQATRREARNG